MQEFLGRAQVTTTLIYIHISLTRKRRVISGLEG